MSTYLKDPSAVLDYKLDLDAWLEVGETVSSHQVTVPTGITLDSSSITDSGRSVTAWLSGGTHGVNYDVVYRFTTSASRTDERTMTIQCRER